MENFKQLTLKELKKWKEEKKDFVLINVLSKESFEGRHIPDSVSADGSESDFIEKVANFVSDKEKSVVVYCASFECKASTRAAEKLVEAGYTNVYDYEGGLDDWQNNGNTFEDGPMETKTDTNCSCCN